MIALQTKNQAYPKLIPLIHYLDSLRSRVDLATIGSLLERLAITVDDVREACVFGDTTYKRNVLRGTDWYDMLLLCWRIGQFSPIHDHANSSCAFKILSGSATEIVYKRVSEDMVEPVMKRTYHEGELCLAKDADIHKIINSNARNTDLITLHIYSPALRMRYYSLDPQYEGSETEMLLS